MKPQVYETPPTAADQQEPALPEAEESSLGKGNGTSGNEMLLEN